MEDQSSCLWQLFVNGNKQAFEKIMLENFRHLFNYGSKFSDDEELVRDAIQELFLRLWDKRSNLSTDVNPKAYLTASLRRALHRKIQFESRYTGYSDADMMDKNFDIEISVEEKMIEKENDKNLAFKIAANMSALPERQREVVYLKFFQELSRDEISETMQITPQTVSNLLQLALKKLRVELKSRILFSGK